MFTHGTTKYLQIKRDTVLATEGLSSLISKMYKVPTWPV